MTYTLNKDGSIILHRYNCDMYFENLEALDEFLDKLTDTRNEISETLSVVDEMMEDKKGDKL